MVNPAKALGRLLLGSLFVTGGLNQLKDPTYGAAKTDELKERYGLAGLPESSALVKANGAAMIAGGVTLALGIKPRTSAAVLAALLQPTTLAGHAFWTIDDPQRAFAERNNFFANLAVTGGLLIAAADSKKK